MISLFDRSGGELVARLRRGLAVVLPDGGRRSIHPSDAGDTARMIALTAADIRAWDRDYTVGTPNGAMTQGDYISRIAAALRVEPVLLKLSSAKLSQAGVLDPDSLWLELTRHELAYDMGRVTGDFPEFRATPAFEAAVAAYGARLAPETDLSRSDGAEARLIARVGAMGSA